MIRALPGYVAVALALLWLFGLCNDATSWLTWTAGASALPAAATVGLIPSGQGSWVAGACLAGVALVLAAAGAIALWVGASAWLAWWMLAFAPVTLGASATVAGQTLLERLRTSMTL